MTTGPIVVMSDQQHDLIWCLKKILFVRTIGFSLIPMNTTWGFLGFLADHELDNVSRLKTSTPQAAFAGLSNDFLKPLLKCS